jgi:hypothetical protein
MLNFDSPVFVNQSVISQGRGGDRHSKEYALTTISHDSSKATGAAVMLPSRAAGLNHDHVTTTR